MSRALRAPAIWRTVGFAVAYAAAVWIGRMTRLDGTPVALAWPAAGVAVLWLMMSSRATGQRVIDLLLIFAVTYAGNRLTGVPGALAAAFGIANGLQAFGTALLAGRALELTTARGSRRALVRLGIASLFGAVVGAVAGPSTVALIDAPAWPIDPTVWIFRNGVSTFALIAAYLAFRVAPAANRDALESTGILFGAALVSGAVFAGVTGVPVAFAILPASVLVGLRCGVRASAIHNLLTWAVVVTATYSGRGPFADYDVNQRVVLTQALVLVVAMITLVVAMSREEERELERRLDDERAFVSALVGQLSENLFICDERGRLQGFDTGRRALVPLATDVAPRQWPAVLGAHVSDGSRLLELEELPLYRALQGEIVDSTEVLVRAGGTERVLMVTAEPIYDTSGRSRGAVARTTDVTELRRAEAEAARRAADLSVIARVTHELARETNVDRARETIVNAAREATGAGVTLLFEKHPDGLQLVCTANSGYPDASTFAVPFNGRPSGTAIAFASGQPFFVPDVKNHPAVNQQMITVTGAHSAVWVPVLGDGGSIAVLAVGWTEPVAELSAGTANMLELLAAEAAIALERSELISQLDSIARTDPLTGAQNRRALTERLAEDLDRVGRSHEPLCVVIADLDHFKKYNDTFGHVQGDRLLKETVAAWGSEVRPTDTIARYGGEEFAFVLPGCGLEAAEKLAQRLRQAVPSNQTCSLGVASWQPGESGEELIQRADAALYRAKNGGRNRVEVDARPLAPAKVAPQAPDAAGSVSQIVLSTTRRLLGMDLAFLSQIDGGRIIFRDLEGDAEAFNLAVDDSSELSGTFCARMLDGRIDGAVADTSADPEHANLPVTQDCGIGAYIGAPVELSDGRVLGTLCGLRSTPATMLTDADLSLIRGLAQTIATHIQSLLGPDPSPDDIERAWLQTVQRISPEPQR